jgi:hypothetical protein
MKLPAGVDGAPCCPWQLPLASCVPWQLPLASRVPPPTNNCPSCPLPLQCWPGTWTPSPSTTARALSQACAGRAAASPSPWKVGAPSCPPAALRTPRPLPPTPHAWCATELGSQTPWPASPPRCPQPPMRCQAAAALWVPPAASGGRGLTPPPPPPPHPPPAGVSLVLDSIVGSTGLELKSDPGVPWVYAGFGLLMVTTMLSYLSHSQVRGPARGGGAARGCEGRHVGGALGQRHRLDVTGSTVVGTHSCRCAHTCAASDVQSGPQRWCCSTGRGAWRPDLHASGAFLHSRLHRFCCRLMWQPRSRAAC